MVRQGLRASLIGRRWRLLTTPTGLIKRYVNMELSSNSSFHIFCPLNWHSSYQTRRYFQEEFRLEDEMKSIEPDLMDRSRNVFVGNLTPSTNRAQLKSHLESTGLKVINSKILRRSDGSSKCCGIVQFENSKDALKAIHTFHGTSLDQRNILVKSDEPETARGYYKRQSRDQVDPNTTLFVTNISFNVDEKQLRELFSTVGDVVSLKYYLSQGDGKPLGRAMIRYSCKESAASAILKFDRYIFERRSLYVRYCNSL